MNKHKINIEDEAEVANWCEHAEHFYDSHAIIP